MDDTRERFLTAIVARLGAERIVELHLFSPIRQGVMETGVAVVATLPDLEPASAGEQAQWRAQEEAGKSVGEESEAVVLDVTPLDASDPPAPVPPNSTVPVPPDATVPLPVNSTVPLPLHSTAPVPLHFESQAASEPVDIAATETPAESRHVVFTAGYRLTRKGVDRGKWFFELAATADAPLATVDMVVRGVMHRYKDLTESERFSGDQLRALLAEPAWRTAR